MNAPVRGPALLQRLHGQHLRQRPEVPHEAAPALLPIPLDHAGDPLQQHEAEGGRLGALDGVGGPVGDEVGGAREGEEEVLEEGGAPAVDLLLVLVLVLLDCIV